MSQIIKDIAENVSIELGKRLNTSLDYKFLHKQNFYHHRALHVCHITCYSEDQSHAWMALMYFELELLKDLAETLIPGLKLDNAETKEDVLTEISNQLVGTFAQVFTQHNWPETDISIPNVIQPSREVKLATLNDNDFHYYLVGEQPKSLELVLAEYDTIRFD